MEAKFFGGRGQGEGVRIVSRRISLPKLKVSEFRIKILSILIEVAHSKRAGNASAKEDHAERWVKMTR